MARESSSAAAAPTAHRRRPPPAATRRRRRRRRRHCRRRARPGWLGYKATLAAVQRENCQPRDFASQQIEALEEHCRGPSQPDRAVLLVPTGTELQPGKSSDCAIIARGMWSWIRMISMSIDFKDLAPWGRAANTAAIPLARATSGSDANDSSSPGRMIRWAALGKHQHMPGL